MIDLRGRMIGLLRYVPAPSAVMIIRGGLIPQKRSVSVGTV